MSDLNEKIEAVQAWINELRQKQAGDPLDLNAIDAVLSDILKRIQQGTAHASAEQGVSETYDVLEGQVQQQPAILTGATHALKSQVAAHETSAIQLRIAYNNLESGLQAFVADHSRLTQLLQEQFTAYKRVQALEKEERALTDAIRDTLATMNSTLDLDKILDHILDTVGRVTPYDGANVLLVESDLVHVVRQRGYIVKGQEREWLDQRIPISKLAILQQLIDIGKPLVQ